MPGSIALVNNIVKLEGDPPYDTTFSVKLAEALFALSPTGPGKTVEYVLRNLTDGSYKSLLTIVEMGQKLSATFQDLCAKHESIACARARPTPRITQDDVVEDVFVDCAPVMLLVFTKSGERYVTPGIDSYDNALTFDEFRAKYGRTVEKHVSIGANRKIRNLVRVRKLLRAKPQTVNVSLISEAGVQTTRIRVFSRDQIEILAARHNATVGDVTWDGMEAGKREGQSADEEDGDEDEVGASIYCEGVERCRNVIHRIDDEIEQMDEGPATEQIIRHKNMLQWIMYPPDEGIPLDPRGLFSAFSFALDILPEVDPNLHNFIKRESAEIAEYGPRFAEQQYKFRYDRAIHDSTLVKVISILKFTENEILIKEVVCVGSVRKMIYNARIVLRKLAPPGAPSGRDVVKDIAELLDEINLRLKSD